jgi:hypothetical protein
MIAPIFDRTLTFNSRCVFIPYWDVICQSIKAPNMDAYSIFAPYRNAHPIKYKTPPLYLRNGVLKFIP